VLGNLGVFYWQQGRMDEAREHFERALALARETGARHTEGALLGYLGGLHGRRGRLEEARTALARGEALLREVGDRVELGKLICHRGECERLAGDLDAAHKALAEAESLRDAVAAGTDSELGREIAKLRQALAPVPPGR
jgi:tetratricopeptide (TPR) repeat protein